MTEKEQASEPKREFAIQRVFVKDISFETPNSPQVFQQPWEPETNLSLNSEGRALGDDHYEVTLNITVTTKLGEKTAYLVEVKQAGIFVVRGFPQEEMGHLMGSYCPNVLFPYAREVISDLVNKGSFPQMVLAPINFDTLYAQHLAKMAQKQPAGAETDTTH